MATRIGAIIALDGEKEFKASVTNVNKELVNLKSQAELVSTQYEEQANTLEALKKKHEVLEKVLEAHKKKEEEVRKGLDHAKQSYDSVGKGLSTLQERYTAASKKMETMKDSSEYTAEEIEKQKKEMDELSDAIKKGEKNYQSAGSRIKDWETKLNTAEAQTIKANRALDQTDSYMKEAEKSTDKCATSIDQFGNATKEAKKETTSFSDALKVGIAVTGVEAATDAMKAFGDATIGVANEMVSATNQVQASTGLTSSAMSKYKEVMEDIYTSNFGNDFDDIGDATSIIVQNLGEIDPSNLEETAKNAITLRDTFGFDYQEQIRTVKMLMDTFGISSEKAFNLIAQGAQKGLNKNGDLLDTINEYSTYYGQMGASANEFFNSLLNGTEAGTFSVDQLGDAYKEFEIRAKDTAASTTEGYQLLNLNVDEMRKKFAAGGDTAKAATSEVLDALFNMDDQVKQNQAGVDLFGTKWEDLGIDGVKALTNLNGEISDTKDVMSSMQDIKYDDMTNQLTQTARTLQMKIAEPLMEKYLPAVNKGLEVVGDNLGIVTTGMIGLGTAIMVNKISKTEIFVSIANAIKKMTEETKGATAATKALNLVQSMTPLGWTITTIGLITGGIIAYQEATKNASDETKNFIKSMKSQREEIEDNLSNYKDTIDGVNSEWAANQKLVDKLYELNDVQDKTTSQKAQMKAIVDQLSEDIPELASAYDAETGSINLTEAALEKIIQKRKEYALSVAAQNSLQDLAQNVTDAELAISQTGDKMDELEEKFKNYGLTMKDGVLSGDVTSATQEYGKEVEDLTLKYMDLAKEQNKNTEARDEASASLENAEDMVGKYSSAVDDVTNSVSNLTTAESGAAAVTSSMTAEQAQAYQEMQQSISDSIENTITAFDKFSGGTEITAQEVSDNLQSQIDGVSNWSDNMKKLGDAAGEGMTQEFYDYLAEMGPESANLVQSLADALDNNTPLFAQICQRWTDAMDLEGPLSENMAKASTTLGMSAEDLKKQNTTIFSSMGEDAEKSASLIGQSFSDALANGLDPTTALSQVDTNMANWQKNAKETSKQSGKDQAKAQGEGMTSESGSVETASKGIFDIAKAQGVTAAGDFHNIGTNMAAGLSNGLSDGKAGVIATLNTFFDDTLAFSKKKNNIHSPSKLYNEAIGVMITRGIAAGITEEGRTAMASMATVCGLILDTAQEELDIHSPSRVFRDKVGAQISNGVAFGIAAKKGIAIKNSKSLADDVYKSASSWLTAYKKSHVISLDDEKYFWNKVAATTKKGTEAYKKALEKAVNIDSFEKTMTKKMQTTFDVSNYTTGSNGEQQIKSAEDYYSDIYSAANKYFDNYSVLHNVSLQQEEYFWTMVQSQMKKGTQGYIDATKKLKEVKAQAKAEAAETVASNKEYALSGGALDAYKTYYNVSAKAEVQYWNIVRKKFKEGTAERIEADQKYYEAKEEYNDKLEDLNDEYYENCKEVNEKLTDDIQDLTDTYNDAVKSRSDSIYSSVGLFDEFESKSSSGQTLLYNLKTQVAGYADWEQQLSKLGGKNVLSQDLLDELSEMGPEASASIHALNQLTDEELKQYEALWEQKKSLSESQAVKDNAALKSETESKIAALKESAQAELDAYKETYTAAVAELNETIETPLKNLANKATTIGEDAVASLIAGIKNGATKKSTTADLKKVNTTVSKQLGKLEDAGKTIGDNTLQGILDGLTNKKKINSSAKDMVAALKKAIQTAADIHSPSRLFKKEVGVQIGAGVTEGIDEESKNVNSAGTAMIEQLLAQQKEKIAQQQATLSAYAASVNSSVGMAPLNNLLSVAPVQQVNATVDNSGLASMFQQMVSVMQSGFESIGNMQMVMDNGALVGELSAGISNDFAKKTKRIR